MALLEADVNYHGRQGFRRARVTERAVGAEDIVKSLDARAAGHQDRQRRADRADGRFTSARLTYSPAESHDLHALRPAGRRQDHRWPANWAICSSGRARSPCSWPATSYRPAAIQAAAGRRRGRSGVEVFERGSTDPVEIAQGGRSSTRATTAAIWSSSTRLAACTSTKS